MSDDFRNVYDDGRRADAYAKLEFPGTYGLAFRNLPDIFREHVTGRRALDFGCGAGRSTRFLRGLGFEVVGVDVAEPMLQKARERDPAGDYRRVPDGDLSKLNPARFDLVLSAFTFDNVAGGERKSSLFRSLRGLLKDGGRIVNLVSSHEIYLHEWASFSTKEFPENHVAKSGDRVKIVMLDAEDRRPIEDILWTHEDYEAVYRSAQLVTLRTYRPLADLADPGAWVSETTVAPWTISVLGSEV